MDFVGCDVVQVRDFIKMHLLDPERKEYMGIVGCFVVGFDI